MSWGSDGGDFVLDAAFWDATVSPCWPICILPGVWSSSKQFYQHHKPNEHAHTYGARAGTCVGRRSLCERGCWQPQHVRLHIARHITQFGGRTWGSDGGRPRFTCQHAGGKERCCTVVTLVCSCLAGNMADFMFDAAGQDAFGCTQPALFPLCSAPSSISANSLLRSLLIPCFDLCWFLAECCRWRCMHARAAVQWKSATVHRSQPRTVSSYQMGTRAQQVSLSSTQQA